MAKTLDCEPHPTSSFNSHSFCRWQSSLRQLDCECNGRTETNPTDKLLRSARLASAAKTRRSRTTPQGQERLEGSRANNTAPNVGPTFLFLALLHNVSRPPLLLVLLPFQHEVLPQVVPRDLRPLPPLLRSAAALLVVRLVLVGRILQT
jgi:hypothetical protein